MLAVIVPMPLELAGFGIGRAAAVVDAFPQVGTWVIGGHSLGGAMVAEFVKGEPTVLDGIAFGHYAPQAGDGVATIDREGQQRQTAATLLAFVRSFD